MEFFALDTDVARLEAELSEAEGGQERLGPLLALAWQMRQRDSGRALELAAQAQALLESAADEGSAGIPGNTENLGGTEILGGTGNLGGAGNFDRAERAAPVRNAEGCVPPKVGKGGAGRAFASAGLRRGLARLALVRGEVKWLLVELDAAAALAIEALREFEALADIDGCSDAHWLLAMVADDQGEPARRRAELEATAAIASVGGDPVRAAVAQAALARFAALRGQGGTDGGWGARFAGGKAGLHPAAGCWAEDYLGIAADQASDFASGVRHFIEAHRLALESGQIRRAVIAATNVGDNLNSLNDYHAALEWMERGLELARKGGWPGRIGDALADTAQTLRHLRRHEAARGMLREALALMAPLAASRSYAYALRYLGDAELDAKDPGAALATFQLMAARADVLGQSDLQTDAMRGQAQALLRLGQVERALQAAAAALEHADGAPEKRITVLRVMAEIHAQHPPPAAGQPDGGGCEGEGQAQSGGGLQSGDGGDGGDGRYPPGTAASSADAEATPALGTALGCLHQALALAASISGYIVPADLLQAVAAAYAAIGDWPQACAYGNQANAARARTHSQEATNRAAALQVTQQSERERAESEHHRLLAVSEAKRAEALRQNGETLERLGAIGQDITAHLDAALVFEALTHHVQHLLDVSSLAIFLTEGDGAGLRLAFGIEDGKPLPEYCVSLNDLHSGAARCVRERREVLVDEAPGSERPELVPGTRLTPSRLFAPLSVAHGVLGAMSVQSFKRFAYGPRERLVFRTLCSYAAIALANCQAHGKLVAAHAALAEGHARLKETQQQLVLQEKMAGLGTLTAGVAHEINNPTNFAHVGAQNLRVVIAEFQHFVGSLLEDDEAPEVVAEFAKRFTKLSLHADIILAGTGRIKGIVNDLRAFTRHDHPEKAPTRLSDCLHSTLNLVRATWEGQVEFATEFAGDPEYDCWPALLNQVFMNLLVNACHACAARWGGAQGKGRVTLSLGRRAGALEVAFADNGTGMSQAVRERIMQPFFTTKPPGQGTGLGLSISLGIVQRHGGELRVESVEGEGSCFTLVLPLAPERGLRGRG